MLRYKVYEVVTHPKFPSYSYKLSLVGFFVALYLWMNPQYIAERAFVSENALTAQTQSHRVLGSDIGEQVQSMEYFELTELEGTGVYTDLVRASRSSGEDCVAFLFPYSNKTLTLTLASDFKKYLEKDHSWLGTNVLLIFYNSSEPYSRGFRNWLDSYFQEPRKYFGLIRLAIQFDLNDQFEYLTLDPSGLNSVQTDIDMLVSMLKLFQKTKLPLKYPYVPEQFKKASKSFHHSLASWKNLVFPNVDSPHAYLLEKGILSVSVKSIGSQKNLFESRLELLKFLELSTRTFTALDEQLHAGYYFYYFSEPWQMVPLGKYSYLIAGLILPLVLQGIMILRSKWFDKEAMVLAVLPFVVSESLNLFTNKECGSEPPKLVWLLFTLSPFLYKTFVKEIDWEVYKAYSNFAMALGLFTTSLHILPLALLFSPLVLVKLFLRKINNYKLKGAVSPLLAVVFGVLPVQLAWNTEACSGHRVFSEGSRLLISSFWQLGFLIV